MNRRNLLRSAAAVPVLSLLRSQRVVAASDIPPVGRPLRRVRPADPDWPSAASWDKLNRDIGGRLIKPQSPLAVCRDAPNNTACAEVFKELRNPYYIGDNIALTETSGWLDAWTSSPSTYAVAAKDTEDVVAAVKFARLYNLRLVVKGGGHSYQGTSNAADSLLIWTRPMHAITLHDDFVGKGCAARQSPQHAVTIEAGARWIEAYDAVMVKAGRYVQGGGCLTVGVAGLIQSGGFGSFSKRFGLAAAGLLEAEVVTADGVVRIANTCTNPDLFWAIKGGGGGSLGVVTRLTLRTRELPDFFGGVVGKVKATSDAAFRRLIAHFIDFYADRLFNPHWGEQVSFGQDNSMTIAMVFQDLDKSAAEGVWQPFLARLAQSPQDFTVETPVVAAAIPARRFFDMEYLRKSFPALVRADDRPGAPQNNVFWTGDQGQVGFFLHGYDSAWLPASLLREDQRPRLVEALFAATRHWHVGFHFNKGLAGAPAEDVAAASDTAMNPAVLDAFALAIVAGGERPAFPGLSGHEPDLPAARRSAAAIGRAMAEIGRLSPERGAYVSEANFFDSVWQKSFWGANYRRLSAVKQKYDPDGLFIVHHGVGSEAWSADGFRRTT